MEGSILDSLRARPVAAKQTTFQVNVPSPDKRKPVELLVPITDKREVENIDRRGIIKRIESKLKTRTEVTDDTVTLKPQVQKVKQTHPITKKAPSSRMRAPIVPDALNQDNLTLLRANIADVTISDDTIEKIPKKGPNVYYKAPAYYQNNREKFIHFINTLFAPYQEQLAIENDKLSCDSGSADGFSDLLTHQKIVRDYINLYTPYRGLLLYHGLGSGKTCSSIAIAEGLKDHRKIWVMNKASLHMNYFKELKKCGDPMYRKNQYWEFISIIDHPDKLDTLSNALYIPKDVITENKGAWMVDTTQPSNYETLNTDEKKTLDDQLNYMIRMKYNFISYNGIRMEHYKLLTENYTINPFNDSVIIIDEAHNFVSRIVNKLTFTKDKKESRKDVPLSILLYKALLSAENCKIVMLTGTPMINYPNELAVMYNILRGYIKTWKIQLEPVGKIDNKILHKLFNTDPILSRTLDFISYTNKELVVTKNPFGFVNNTESGNYNGVNVIEGKEITSKEFQDALTKKLTSNKIKINDIKIEGYLALPDNPSEFNQLFLDNNNTIKNINLFKKRIIGLTSYFNSAAKLLPKYNDSTDFHIIELDMSDYQFQLYEKVRVEERKLEKKNSKSSGDDKPSTYRVFSRAYCNFVFPPSIERPTPKASESIEQAVEQSMDENILDGANVTTVVNNIDGEHTMDDVENLQKVIQDKTDKSYNQRIEESLSLLKAESSTYLSREALETYSPKFLEILNNVTKLDEKRKVDGVTPYYYSGSHLIYSQFRTIEGIEIIKLILEYHNFVQFKIAKTSGGEWTVPLTEEDKYKPKFILYTGTESAEEKEILREVFNGNWDNIPTAIRDFVTSIPVRGDKNNMGEIVRIFMITSSGAEGIDLKNVRWVHITEPYWHPVRIKQVIGRALRICSHKDLPEELQTVNVFLYLMKFTESQLKGNLSIELIKSIGDKSKINPSKVFTSDQTLYEIANIKDSIQSQLIKAIKESALDCALHTSTNNSEQLVCFNHNNPTSLNFGYRPMIISQDHDDAKQLNVVSETIKLRRLDYGKKVFALDKLTMNVYDWNKYNENPRVLQLIGVLEKKDKTYVINKI
tara:strand:+ start:4554 stop:7826 length:3273 start_codon:yes stop_codon:yes gene_type:complete